MWSLPEGSPRGSGRRAEQAAVREVEEETGIRGRVLGHLGTIDFWFVAEQRRVHKTVHHYLLEAEGGELSDDDVEVVEVAWVPLDEVARAPGVRRRAPSGLARDGRARRARRDPWPARMTPTRSVPSRRTLGALAAAFTALSVLIGLVGASPAPALDGPGGVTVTLTGLTPVVPRTGDDLTITGVLTNTTAAPVRDVQVRLRVSPTPVRNRGEIADILAGAAGRTGLYVERTRTDVTKVLQPGAAASFTFSVPLSALPLSRDTNEVVVLGVESISRTGQEPATQTGFTRTFLPWFPVPEKVRPTRVVWLWPLTTTPSRATDSVFLDDHLGDEVSEGGRLSHLLDAADATPETVSWVVDPALLESLLDMADGYEVRSADGTLVPGTQGPAALTWLDRLRDLTGGAEVTASSYADPDVVALHRWGLDVDIALAATTASGVPDDVLGRPVPGGLAWPPNGLSDDGTLDVLRATGARVVVLSAAALPPSPSVNFTPSSAVDLATGGSPLRAAAFDPTVSRLVMRPGPSATTLDDDAVGRRQQVLAEIALTTLQLPNVSRSFVIAPAMRWATDVSTGRDLVDSITDSPWARPYRLDALVTGGISSVPRERADYPPAARKAELTRAYLTSVARTRDSLAGLRSVAPDVPGTGTTGTEGVESALTRAESAAWREDRSGGRELVAVLAREIDAQIAQVRVLSRAPVTLPGDSGVIPVTVANDLDRPARVGVRLTGTPTVRFEAEEVAPITLAPGQKRTLEVTARVVGTGAVDVDIVLLTPEGDEFGEPVRTEVRSAAYALAAQWVVIGLFAILVVLLAVNVLRRRRTRAGAPGGTA